MTRRVVITRPFEAYPGGEKRRFAEGEEVTLDDDFARFLVETKGFAAYADAELGGAKESSPSRSVFSKKSQRLNSSGS